MLPVFHRSFRGRYSLDAKRNTVLTEIDNDHSQTKQYQINTLGFRGAEYDPTATRRLFVFGCSHTFGTGLNRDEIWPHFLHAQYCAHHGLAPDEVNLMNFGISGASNQEIARMVLLECSVVTPDLVVVQFTHPERCERVFGDEVLAISPWTPEAQWLPPERREAAADYYRHYRDEYGASDLIRQMLHVQHALRLQRIPHVTAAVDLPRRLTRPTRALLRLLDHRRTVWLPSQFRRLEAQNRFVWWQQKFAADNEHYGPRVHQAAAELVWRRHLANLTA